jgi:voltage-gated potassium channel
MEATKRWEHLTEWPLTAVALVFLAAYAIPIAVPGSPEWVVSSCENLVWATWAIFALDYLVRLSLAERKWKFIKANLLDLAVVALPLLRPLRLVRLLALLSILNRTSTQQLRGRVVTYTVGATALLLVVGALAVTDAERNEPGANIATLGDGFWWAVTTIATVGYGDRYPVTPTGRFVAVALMVCGIALLGVVTATIASWLVQRVAAVTEKEEAATRAQVERLAEEIADLRAQLKLAGPVSHRDDGPALAASRPAAPAHDHQPVPLLGADAGYSEG